MAELADCNPDAEVIIKSPNFELGGANVSATCINHWPYGKKQIQQFRDAFDGGSYSAETYDLFDGDLHLISIG